MQALRIKSKETRKLISALQKYGCKIRFNGAHYIVKCPLGSSVMSTKNDHVEKQWAELERLGIDIERLRSLYK